MSEAIAENRADKGHVAKTKAKIEPVSAPKETLFRKYYYQVVTALEILVDYLTVFVSFFLAMGTHASIGLSRFEGLKDADPFSLVLIFQVAIACAVVIFVFGSMGLYRKSLSLLNIDEMRKLFRSVLVLAIVVFTISFYFRIPFSRLLITIWLCLILFFMAKRFVWEWALLRAATPVARGAAWNSHTKDLTCSQEYANIDRETRWNSIGFRCAYPVQKCE